MDGITKCHFLVLEDNEDEAFLIKRAFAKAHTPATAFLCRNLSEAKAYLKGAGMYSCEKSFPKPQVIISDLHLGIDDGLDFLVWIRGQPQWREITVIVLTGSANPDELVRARLLGATEVIQKPATLVDLTKIIETLSLEWCNASIAEMHPGAPN